MIKDRYQNRKKRVLKKAPNAPKRFKSSYIFFIKEKLLHYTSIINQQKANNDGEVCDIRNILLHKCKEFAAIWQSLSESDKTPYENAAKLDKLRYYEDMRKYNGPQQVPNIRKKKSLDTPKRGISAFFSYYQMHYAQVRMSYPTESNKVLMKVLSKQWQQADRNCKQIHIDRELIERQQYHQEMIIWKENNERCINLEDCDVVRNNILDDILVCGEIIDIDSLLEANMAMIESNDLQLVQNAVNIQYASNQEPYSSCSDSSIAVPLNNTTTTDVSSCGCSDSSIAVPLNNTTTTTDVSSCDDHCFDWNDLEDDFSSCNDNSCLNNTSNVNDASNYTKIYNAESNITNLPTLSSSYSIDNHNYVIDVNNDVYSSGFSDYIHNNLTEFVTYMDTIRNNDKDV